MDTVKSQKSFTLVELLVAVTIFTIIVTISTGIFFSALQAQKKLLASQELFDQVSFLIEYMSRTIRMAKKELSAPACLSQNGLNYEIGEVIPGKSGLKFKNYDGICQGFFLDNQILKEWKEGYTEPLSLTSSNLRINPFNINLSGQSQTDNLQPRVTIFFEIEGKEQSKIKIQTTVSQRNPDVEK